MRIQYRVTELSLYLHIQFAQSENRIENISYNTMNIRRPLSPVNSNFTLGRLFCGRFGSRFDPIEFTVQLLYNCYLLYPILSCNNAVIDQL